MLTTTSKRRTLTTRLLSLYAPGCEKDKETNDCVVEQNCQVIDCQDVEYNVSGRDEDSVTPLIKGPPYSVLRQGRSAFKDPPPPLPK